MIRFGGLKTLGHRTATFDRLATLLAIDLWRWRTGRATAVELGWTLRSARRPNAVRPWA
jgi:hypothetical protein